MAMLIGMPPHMLGQVDRTTSWGTGIEQQNLGFLTYTFDDWLQHLRGPLDRDAAARQSAVFDTGSLLRTDTAGRMAAYVQGRTGGFITTNEIRARENMPPVDGGDDIAAPLNSAHTGDPAAYGRPGPRPDEGGNDDDLSVRSRRPTSCSARRCRSATCSCARASPAPAARR
jgi:hypothetical protein